MKFWQLLSIMRSDTPALEHLLKTPEWSAFSLLVTNRDTHISKIKRENLDTDVPAGLARAAMHICRIRFILQEGYLFVSNDDTATSYSALSTFDNYGASAIEDVLEFGSVLIQVNLLNIEHPDYSC